MVRRANVCLEIGVIYETKPRMWNNKLDNKMKSSTTKGCQVVTKYLQYFKVLIKITDVFLPNKSLHVERKEGIMDCL